MAACSTKWNGVYVSCSLHIKIVTTHEAMHCMTLMLLDLRRSRYVSTSDVLLLQRSFDNYYVYICFAYLKYLYRDYVFHITLSTRIDDDTSLKVGQIVCGILSNYN